MESAPAFVHDAFAYSTDAGFLAGAVPFVRDGLSRCEPVMAAPGEGKVPMFREALGADADCVDWVPSADDHRPAERLELFQRYIAERVDSGATRVRLLGEPPWPADCDAGVTEWKRYESYLNIALAGTPVWLVCPYDARLLSAEIVADASCTHPWMGHGSERQACGAYVDPGQFARRLDEEAPFDPPPGDAVALSFERLGEVRNFIGREGSSAGLDADRVVALELATNEVAANAMRHAAQTPVIRTWQTTSRFVCEVADSGPGIDDAFVGLSMPEPTRPDGRGLVIARRLSDVVEVRAGQAGTTVRLHFALARG